MGIDRQITYAPQNHLLTNTAVWSADGQWIVYDVRSDPDGSTFDGNRIERIHARTGEVQLLYRSQNGAKCGVATCHPLTEEVVFIQGPEHPTPKCSYAACRRGGVIVDAAQPSVIKPLDARDLTPPFTQGALRGGTHLHVFSDDGRWVSFTYEDQILESLQLMTADHDCNQRNIGVSVPCGRVLVPRSHPRNHEGDYFSVLVTRTVNNPTPESDEILRASEESWVGRDGYIKPDGTRQHRAIAFQGQIIIATGESISEVFIVDLPDDVTIPGDGPLQGTETRRPFPPRGTVQRRLTFTASRRHPGLQGPRHWLRSSPDGTRIAFLMKDDGGVVQLWTVSPNGGPALQLTHNRWSIDSAFTWSPEGRFISHVMDHSVFATDTATGESIRLTCRSIDSDSPRPEACVFSPDGLEIAYVRNVAAGKHRFNQIFVTTLNPIQAGVER